MSLTTPASHALAAIGIAHSEFVHFGPIHSLEQAAAERGQHPEQIVRSLLFRLSEGKYALVLVAGRRQVSWKTLRRYLGQRRLTTASEEEVLAVTGYPRGAVCPFGLPEAVHILVDRSVTAHKVISLGSGVRGTAIVMHSADLMKALGDVDVGDFVEE